MIHSMVMMRELPGARHVAIWVISLYGFTTVPWLQQNTVVLQKTQEPAVDSRSQTFIENTHLLFTVTIIYLLIYFVTI